MEADDQVSVLRYLCSLVLGLCCWGLLSQALAHPSHHSYAEVEWSAAGTFDVALKVIPEDLEAALTFHSGEPVVLVDTPRLRETLTTYLGKHFQLMPDDAAEGLELVGLQLDYRDCWIYFSIPADQSRITGLKNTILMDQEAGQSNRVRRLWEPQAPTLVFTPQEPLRDL